MREEEAKHDRLPDKALILLHGELKTPPLSDDARREAGFRLRALQQGHSIGLPHSRPMPSIGPRCHELRINDKAVAWRIFYRIDADAILIAAVEEKKTPKTPKRTIESVRERFRKYDEASSRDIHRG